MQCRLCVIMANHTLAVVSIIVCVLQEILQCGAVCFLQSIAHLYIFVRKKILGILSQAVLWQEPSFPSEVRLLLLITQQLGKLQAVRGAPTFRAPDSQPWNFYPGGRWGIPGPHLHVAAGISACRQHLSQTLQSLSGISPTYLADDCRLVTDVRERRLRSTESWTCVVARTYSSFGDRAFAAAGPVLYGTVFRCT